MVFQGIKKGFFFGFKIQLHKYISHLFPNDLPCKVADFGCKEIGIVEHEMPGLMSLHKKYAGVTVNKVRE